jgi:hypothetical protein
MDAQVLPNGNVLIAEANAHRVTERDLKGVVKWEKKIELEPMNDDLAEPNSFQRLKNGNTFVSTTTRVMEFAPDGSLVYSFKPDGGPIKNAACKDRNGHILYSFSTLVVEWDTTGKRVGSVEVQGKVSSFVSLEALPGTWFLLAECANGSVIETVRSATLL